MNAAWPTPPAPPELSAGEVQVWRASISALDAPLQRLRDALPGDEQERSRRYRIAADQARYIVARALTRRVLAHHLQIPDREIQLVVGPIGKPCLATPVPLQFNATHSGDLVLVAVARDAEVGVDVEHLRPLPRFQELAERYYCQREIATLAALPPDVRQRAFFLAWTRKEALLKAVGKGLTFPLCDVEVTLAPGEPARLVKFGDVAGDAAPWRLAHLEPAEDYVAAIACAHRSPAVRQFTWAGD